MKLQHLEIKVSWSFGMPTVKVCQKKVDSVMQKHRDKLPEHAKIEDLMNNWDILDISYEFIDLVGCAISDSIKHKHIYIRLDVKKYLAQQYEHSVMFHKEKKLYLKKVGVWILKSK